MRSLSGLLVQINEREHIYIVFSCSNTIQRVIIVLIVKIFAVATFARSSNIQTFLL